MSRVHGDLLDPAGLCLLLVTPSPLANLPLVLKKELSSCGSLLGSMSVLPERTSFSTALPVPVMSNPSTALNMLITAGQSLRKNCPAGRAGLGGERMQDEKTVGEREYGEKSRKEKGTEVWKSGMAVWKNQEG